MPKLLTLSYVGMTLLFTAGGLLMLAICIKNNQVERKMHDRQTVDNNLLLTVLPVTSGLINGAINILIALLLLPVLALPLNKFWLKLQGYCTLFSLIYTLCLGLVIWTKTLQTQKNLWGLYANSSTQVQSLIQQKYDCCGYFTTPFVIDSVCPDQTIAQGKNGCQKAMATNANSAFDIVFTSAFGLVGVATLQCIWIAMMVKSRGETIRYISIDEKDRF